MPSASHSKPFIHTPLIFKQLPEPILYLERTMPADTLYPPHRHSWGEFVYSFSGVLELEAQGAAFRVPSHYALWLPPGAEHQGRNRHESFHCSLYVDAALCGRMPESTCALIMTPLIRELLNYLKHAPPQTPYRPDQQRLLQVVFDQLACTTNTGRYLPHSTDPLLSQLLEYFEQQPACHQSLSDLAQQLGTTERTLNRKALRDLGVSLLQWRQRLRVVCAMHLLESGEKVESIALELGYSTASAFIAMFRKLVGKTPDEYRRSTTGDKQQKG